MDIKTRDVLLDDVIGFAAIVVLLILLSTLFRQSLDQFAFTDGFSFPVGGTSALMTILLAATIENEFMLLFCRDSLINNF